MRAIYSTLAYQLRGYLKTSKPVMPFAAQLLAVGLLYAVMPVYAADSYAASATILCFIAAWIGLTYADVEDPVGEQLLVLKLGSIARFQAAYTLFLVLLGLFSSALAVVQPLLVHAANGFRLYKTPITPGTVGFALLLHACCAFMGTAVGAFFHPRLVPNRKAVLLLICFVLIVGFVRAGLHRLYPWTAAITWAFPPIGVISEVLAGSSAFAAGQVLRVAVQCLLYGCVLTGLRIILLCRRRFS